RQLEPAVLRLGAPDGRVDAAPGARFKHRLVGARRQPEDADGRAAVVIARHHEHAAVRAADDRRVRQDKRGDPDELLPCLVGVSDRRVMESERGAFQLDPWRVVLAGPDARTGWLTGLAANA